MLLKRKVSNGKKAKYILAICAILGFNSLIAVAQHATEVLDIGSNRELFIDDYLLESMTGDIHFDMHHPVEREIVLVHDQPWEGNTCSYHSIFKDGDIYRMYYRASHISMDLENKRINVNTHPWQFCYAESKDGKTWVRPNLGINEFNGSKDNNIVFSSDYMKAIGVKLFDNATFFKDANPKVKPDALYKAIVAGSQDEKYGLYAFKSPDGIHWTPLSEKPIIIDGHFDSQNIAFWDEKAEIYRAYWRYFDENGKMGKDFGDGIRAIRTATSTDFINWSEHQNLSYIDSPREELYTNQIQPYYRAPQILLGFPARYTERGWDSPSMAALPDSTFRKQKSSVGNRFGMAIVDCMLMSSRDGKVFNRKNEAFMRPGIERTGTWNYGPYFGWGILETESDLKGADLISAPNELSFYVTENMWSPIPYVHMRRFTLRIDGFVSLSASAKGGCFTSKALTFTGSNLYLNFSTSGAGYVRVELQDVNGQALPGFSLDDCYPVFGDTLSRVVTWKNKKGVEQLSGKTVKLVFEVKDADIFSFQFRDEN